MNEKKIDSLIQIYREDLLNNILPFWINNSVDHRHGGFMFCLDRDGTVIDSDKGMWQNCRFTWLLATLYSDVEKRSEWLNLAKHGIDFIRKHGFDEDGRMFFLVSRKGEPLRKRRYLFTETFATIAFAAYAKASRDNELAERACNLFRLIVDYHTRPFALESKNISETRSLKSLSMPMILISTAQVLRGTIGDLLAEEWIDRCIDEIRNDFLKPSFKAVMETVSSDGVYSNHFDGRMLNPGHAIECAWFILHEAKYRGNDPDLIQMGTTMLDWMWEIGWDKEYGGIFYNRDVKGLPVQEYWHDMKFWWPHCEAIIATLLAYQLTGEQKYSSWHEKVHNWTYSHFPDPIYGEWYGYLHRDGRISVDLKGNIWKGPFHIPRMLWYSWRLLEEIQQNQFEG